MPRSSRPVASRPEGVINLPRVSRANELRSTRMGNSSSAMRNAFTASSRRLTDDSELAFRVHALLGGTPACRAMAFGPPSSWESFDRWVTQRLLNPASAIFREGGLLLREKSGVTDRVPYHGVLTAIATGAARRSEIAGRIGRPATAIVVEPPAGARPPDPPMSGRSRDPDDAGHGSATHRGLRAG